MFTDLLSKPASSRFILIEGSSNRSSELLNYLIRIRTKEFKEVHYFAFEGVLKSKQLFNFVMHDFCTDIKGWLKEKPIQSFEEVLKALPQNTLIVIDSLIHVTFEYGFQKTYKLLNDIVHNRAVEMQIIALTNTHLTDDDLTEQCFNHLSTFVIRPQNEPNSDKKRISYKYKKSTGKIIDNTEEYWFEGEVLKTKAIEPVDPKKLIEKEVEVVLPDELTTFKISLEEHERKARDSLVLPYYPKKNTDSKQGSIFYEFDEQDDYDEEDPDDDLDI